MGKFSKIKKYNLDSLSIDEKIKSLNKEMEKTGLNEVAANSTAGVYSSNETQPNPAHTTFAASSFNGLPLGFSGHDGTDMGGAYTGKVIASEHGLSSPSHDHILNLEGVAVSPPHPVSGKRTYATTRTGMVSFSPTQPGKIQGNSDVPTGSVMWIWNPNANNSDGTTGQWYPLEFDVIRSKWGFWDTNFLGFGFLNINLDQLEFTSGDNTGTTLNTLVTNNGLNVQNMGQPDTTVLVTKSLESADNLPIMIDGLSGPGYEYIKSKALASTDPNIAFFGNKGKGKVTKKLFKGPIANTLNLLSNQIINGQDFNGQLQKQFDKITGGSISPEKYNELYPQLTNPSIKETEFNKILDDANKSSVDDDLDSFASAGYEPEIVTVPVDSTKDAVPDAKDAKLGTWMSRQDFVQTYKGSSMQEYLDSLPYGATNFMKPDPNFPGARIVDTDAYEKYFMSGDTSGLSDSEPKHTKTSVVPPRTVAPASAAKPTGFLDTILSVGADAVGRGAAKDVYDYYMKNVDAGTNGGEHNVNNLLGRSTRAIERWYARNKTNIVTAREGGKSIFHDAAQQDFMHLSQTDGNLKNITGNLDLARGDGIIDKGDTLEIIKHYDFNGERDLAGGGVVGNLGSKRYAKSKGIMKYLGDDGTGTSPLMKLVITIDQKTGRVKTSKSMKESLDESVKLGHFNPEALTVDIEKLRKGILPEFPKDAPPKMIDGYSEKSKLAPKKAEKEPFIKITKKDLAKNHKLKDSEIKEFMDTFKMINDFIKKHPEELIHAQQRYPVGDKRLAELNWKMDQMLEAGQEYLDTQFPENQRLVDRVKKATKKTMELTNPEAYKNLKKPDMELMSLDNYMKEKRVVSRHFKKKRKSKSMFRVNMEKVKEKNRKVAEQKVAEWQEKRRIELLNSNEFDELKYDWRKELGESMTTQVFQEQPTFKAVPLPSTGMNSSQDFAMFTNIGGMHNDTGVRFTLSGLGGTESLPIFNYPLEAGGSVKAIDVFAMGQNNSVQIDLSNFGLQGRTIPLGSKLSRRLNKKKEEDMNKQLNSSENFTKKINADEYMKARVTNVRIDKAALEKQKADEKFLDKQQTIVNLTKGFGMIGLPNDFAQWALNYARGNFKPITKFSRSMTNQVRNLVLDKFANSPSGTKTVSIIYGDYGGNPFNKISTKLGLGKFDATILPNGDIKITDTFNVDKTATHIGAAQMIPGLQDTADRLVKIAHERRGISGDYDAGGIPINVIIKNSGRFAADAEHNKNRRSMQRGKYYSGLK